MQLYWLAEIKLFYPSKFIIDLCNAIKVLMEKYISLKPGRLY